MNTIHFGIITQEHTPDVFVPSDFINDNDSFLDWGEPRDHTIHLSINTHIEPTFDTIYTTPDRDALKLLIEEYRDTLFGHLRSGQRLADYVVVTDREDWSENQHIWLLDGSFS